MMQKLSERWMFYSGLLATKAPIDDLKHIQNLIDAEEQGLLFRLPCKAGDTIYLVDFDEGTYDEATVISIEMVKDEIQINSDYEIGTDLNAKYLRLSKEEAEAALQKMQEGE